MKVEARLGSWAQGVVKEIEQAPYIPSARELTGLINRHIQQALPAFKIARDSRLIIVPPEGSFGEFWSIYNPKQNAIKWFIELVDRDEDNEREVAISTIYHELLHLEQAIRVMESKTQEFLQSLSPATKWFDILSSPLGPKQTSTHRMKNPLLEDPFEIGAYAGEVARILKRLYPKGVIREILKDMLENPEATINDYFDKSNLPKNFLKFTPAVKNRFLKKVYQDLSAA